MKVRPNGIAIEIRAELARQQLTLSDLADRSGISYSTVIRKVSQGTGSLNVGELAKIARALDLAPHEIMRRAEAAAAIDNKKTA